MKRALQRFWYGNMFYRLPRTIRTIGYIGQCGVIGPFGIAYRTYSHHRFDTPILGRERKLTVKVFDK